MIQPQPSGSQKGKPIFLEQIKGFFDDFKIKEPIAWIVGGLANHGSTPNDIDILINLPPEEADTSLAKVLRFRIQRSLPKEYWERLHWLYNDGAGPFTSNIPLFSLEARKTDLQRQEMKAESITPLKFFKQLKAIQGRYKKDIFTIKALQEIIPKEEYPVEVNMKYDGMRAQLHHFKDVTKFFSEEGTEITGRFPTFAKQLQAHNTDIILDVEITGSENSKPIGRSDVSGYVHSKGAPDDLKYTANVHDIVWHKGQDIHELPRIKRLREFQALKLGNKFNIIPYKVVNTSDELKKAVEHFSQLKGSEGAMVKSLASSYELDGLTSHWWKYKKDFVIDAKIIKTDKINGSFNYLCVIDNNIPVGKTYNTNLKANVGDIIQVAFGNINKYIDGERSWYNWVFPRVIGIQEKTKPDDAITADILNKESGGFIEDKAFPQRYRELLTEDLIKDARSYDPKSVNDRALLDDHRITHAWASIIISGRKLKHSLKEVIELHNKIASEIERRGFGHHTPIELPRETSQKIAELRKYMTTELDKELFSTFDEFMLAERKKRFVFQHHWRGKSVHGDLRFEDISGKMLQGWTLMIEKEKEIQKPILTLEDAKRADSQDIFKIDYKEGSTLEQKIQVVQKGTQPLVWLTIEGIAKPGTVGATRQFPAVFDIVDKGVYEMGADKPFFKEYFIHGSIFKGRYVMRKLPASGNFKDSGTQPFVWYFWKTEEQTPYILSTRATRKKDFPIGDNSTSWLPFEWENKIPDELRWWGKDLTREEAVELIKEARKHLMKKQLLSNEANKQETFILHHHWWKGQKVIRDLPVEHWDLRFSQGYEFTLDKNPVFDPSNINAIYKKGHDVGSNKAFIKEDYVIKAGEQGNPNKRIDANITTLDDGSVNIISHTEHFMLAEFKGKHLKGIFTLKQVDVGSNQWLMSKGKLPRIMSITLDEYEIEQIIDLSDPQLDLTRSEIASHVGCSEAAVYAWQKRSNII